MNEHPVTAVDHEYLALQRRAENVAVGLIDTEGETEGNIFQELISSACAVSWKEKSFILTAKHCLPKSGNFHTLRFFFAGVSSHRVALAMRAVHQHENADLAAIELFSPLAHTLEIPETLAPAAKSALVVGFPNKNREAIQSSTTSFLVTIYSEVLAVTKAEHRPSYSYDPSLYNLWVGSGEEKYRDVVGFSGAPLLTESPRQREGTIWTPALRLAGIQSAMFRSTGVLQVVNTQIIAELFESIN
jgi:hypothetical protein